MKDNAVFIKTNLTIRHVSFTGFCATSNWCLLSRVWRVAPVNFPALSSHRMVPSHVIASSFNLGNVVGFRSRTWCKPTYVVPASLDLGYSSYAKQQFSFINSVDEVNEEKH